MVLKTTWFIALFCTAVLIYSFKTVGGGKQLLTTQVVDTTSLGRTLALKYCEGCHLFTEPYLLDKSTWVENVLPNMGMRLGLRDVGNDPFQDLSPIDAAILKELNIFPDSPLINRTDWDEIVKYYKNNAPETPIIQKNVPTASPLTHFTASFRTFTKKTSPKTSLLKFNPASSQLYIGDAHNELFILDSTFQLKANIRTPSPPADIDFTKSGGARLLTIGSIIPSDQKQGQLIPLNKSNTFFKDLPRPVHFAASDINGDQKEDLVICGFGNHTGKLAWYDNSDQTKEHIIKALPGARKVEIKDFDKDNKPDIIVLMAQAYEGISIFYNVGNGKFKERRVVDLPPVYGVSYFELADFNNDGHDDILLTTGDNWDLSSIRKNYHGIRIYLNDGKNKFKESWFYPFYGTSKAMVRDFDNDGHLDIAAISFYADLDNPEESFIYLSGRGNLTFKSFSTPEAAHGKWLTMETGDFDQDGDLDIVLGSYFHNMTEMTKLMFNGITTFPQLLILTNKYK